MAAAALPGQSLSIVKTAGADVAPSAWTVTFTIVVTNTGTVPYTADAPATFTDDLTGTLDDAFPQIEAPRVDIGTATYELPALVWSGPLDVGQTATVAYDVRVKGPGTDLPLGDKWLRNTVTGPPESTCPTGTETGCTVDVPVKAYGVTLSASGDSRPGGVINFVVTATNVGAVPYTAEFPAEIYNELYEVVDDATFNDDLVTDSGTVSFTRGYQVNWEGPLEVGETATTTYSVTVNEPETGNRILYSMIQTNTKGGNCYASGFRAADAPGDLVAAAEVPPVFTPLNCFSLMFVEDSVVTKTSDAVGTVDPGTTITYTITVTNNGSIPYTVVNPMTVADDLTGLLDDAVYNDDATADIGTVAYEEPVLAWSGALQPGETATITYSITVNNPMTGDGILPNIVVAPTSNCALDAISPDCLVDLTVTPPPAPPTAPPTDPTDPVTPSSPTTTATSQLAATGPTGVAIGWWALLAVALGSAAMLAPTRRARHRH